MAETSDYIIVGGGTAGLVLAARLSEDAGTRVLVLEAGEDQAADPRVLTPALWPTLLNTPSDWAYRTVPQKELDNREILFPQGRLLGGSSGLNGLAFTPTSKSSVEAWAKLDNPGWDWSTVAKYFRKSYTLTNPSERATKHLQLGYIDEGVRGVDGPIQLSFPEEPDNHWAKAWLDTLASLGHPPTGDPFSGEAQGAYINAESVHPTTKQRSFSANAYLAPALGRTNLTVITAALVEKIVLGKSLDGTAVAQGVRYNKDGDIKTAAATKEVILTAGAFNSPRLLELSGIGSAELLQPLGIPVVIDNPNVGENLQNHPMCGRSFPVIDGLQTMDSLARQEPAALGAAMDAYGSKQAGPFAHSGTYASAQLPLPDLKTAGGIQALQKLLESVATSDEAPFAQAHRAYVQEIITSAREASGCYISFPGYAAFLGDGSMAPPPADGAKYFSVAALLTHPLSRGSVHISSASPTAKPDIDPRYLSEALDLEILARHVLFIDSAIVQTEPLRSLLKPTSTPAALKDLDAAKDYVRRSMVGAHHPTGTCAMMPRAKGGVVDAQLRVHGCKNLRVCDASVFPISPRLNPQATVYAVAERAADLIRQ